MGATSRMYDLIKRKVSFHINYLDWPGYRNERTFRDVAQRIIAEHGIGKSDIVGGSSLGGMVALWFIFKPHNILPRIRHLF